MAHLIRAFASIFIVSLIGYALVLLIFRAKPIRNNGLNVILSLGLGFGFLAECCLIYLALTGRIDFRIIYASFVLGIVVILYEKKAWQFWGRSLFSFLREALRKDVDARKTALQRAIVCTGLSLIAIVLIVVTFNLLARPMYQFDPRAIWGQKAQILYHERTIFSEAVEDISSNHPHPRYPLLLPIASAWIFENMGEIDDRAVRLLFLAFSVGLILAAYQLQRVHTEGVVAVSSLCALLLVPFLYRSMRGGASSGHADLLVSFYITASALAMLSWMKEGNRSFMIAGALLAACAALTKNEGTVFVINLFVTTIFFSFWRDRRRQPGESEKSASFAWFRKNSAKLYGLASYVFIVAVMLLPWFCVRSGLPKFLDEDYVRHLDYRGIAAGLHRLPAIVKFFIAELLNIRNWSVIWILIVASLGGIGRTWKRESYFIFVLMTLQLSSYLAVFVITPDELAVQMRDSLPRLLFHVLPLGVTLLSYQLADSRRIAPERRCHAQ